MKKSYSLFVIFILACLAAGDAAADETTSQNPVTAAPPIVRPNTKSCSVTIADNFAFTFDNPDIGTYQPPADCPAPWAKVVLDFDGTVKGRQFDRIGGVWISQKELLRTSTPEPTPAGITWHVEKDVTEYSSVLSNPASQQSIVRVSNFVVGPFTGIIFITAKLTFYEPGAGFPAASVPDAVLPIATGGPRPFFSLRNPAQAASSTLSLPTNIERAVLQVYASAHSCDEFWYANEPTSFAGNCGGGTAFRELQVFIDGQLAGVAWPFPLIYTGGINPFLWRPIPGVNAFNIPPYVVDLTPFAGLLSNGQPHAISVQVFNAESFWLVDADLELSTDHGSAATSGQVTSIQIDPAPNETVVQNVNTNGGLFDTTATRSLRITGLVDTSAGRITTTVSASFSFTNNQVLDLINFRENLKGTEVTDATVSNTDASGNTTLTHTIDSFPISLASMFQVPSRGTASFFILPAKVDQNFERTVTVTTNGAAVFSSSLLDNAHAAALLIEGSNLVRVGSTSETYIASDSTGACFNHFLHASQGFVDADTLRPNCVPLTLP